MAGFASLAGFASFLVAAVFLIVLRLRPVSFPGIFHLVLLVNLGIAVAMTLLFGGFLESGVNFIWAVALVLGALVAFGDWRAGAWLGAILVAFVASTVGAYFVEPIYELPDPEVSAVVTFVIVLVFASLVFWYYVRQRAELLEVSNDLLENILPVVIADRLKESGG